MIIRNFIKNKVIKCIRRFIIKQIVKLVLMYILPLLFRLLKVSQITFTASFACQFSISLGRMSITLGLHLHFYYSYHDLRSARIPKPSEEKLTSN